MVGGDAFETLTRGGRYQARVHFETTLGLEPNHSHAARIRRWLRGSRE